MSRQADDREFGFSAGSTHLPGSQSMSRPVDDRIPRDWSIWLLPAAAVMLLVGAVAVYYVPTNLDLIVPLRIWLCLSLVPLLLVIYRDDPVLKSPSNNEIRFGRRGRPIIWNRLEAHRVLLFLAFGAAGYAAFLLVFRFDSHSFYNLDIELGSPFLLLAGSSLLATLLWLVWLTRFETLLALLQMRFSGAVASLFVLALFAALYAWLPPFFSPSITTASGLASWSTVLQSARHQAESLDTSVVLWQVKADPPDHADASYTPETSPLDITFSFECGNGADFGVELLDTVPTRFVRIGNYAKCGPGQMSEDMKELSNRFSYVKLGPRDVYSLTRQERDEFARQVGGAIVTHINLDLYYNSSSRFGVPAVWSVIYAPGHKGIDYPLLAITVDASNGAILDRKNESLDATPTPAPAP